MDVPTKVHDNFTQRIDYEDNSYLRTGRENPSASERQIGDQLRQLWKQFLCNSSVHCLKSIGSDHRKKLLRFIYFFAVLACFFGLGYNMHKLILRVMKFNTVTKTDVHMVHFHNFPSVTVCNMCPYKEDDSIVRDINLYTIHLLKKMMQETSDFGNSTEFQKNFQWTPTMNASLGASQTQYWTKNDFKKFVRFARFRNEKLSESDFEKLAAFPDSCLTFNGPSYVSTHGPRQTYWGRLWGLRMMLEISQSECTFEPVTFDASAAVRVYISDYADTPDFVNGGFHLHVGQSTQLVLRPTKYTFLPAPYTSYNNQTCDDRRHDHLPNSFTECLYKCKAVRMGRICQCNVGTPELDHLPDCPMKEFIDGCVARMTLEWRERENLESCLCSRYCTCIHYDIIVSTTDFPPLASRNGLYSTKHSSGALLELNVLFDSMMETHVKHEPEVTVDSFLSALGGHMGIFLGASLLSVAELLEALTATAGILMDRIFKRERHLQRHGQDERITDDTL